MQVFCVPYQFLPRMLPTIRATLPADLSRVKAVSLIKAVAVEDDSLYLVSDIIRRGLGEEVDVSVLMGANVANEVAQDKFCEATIGYRNESNAAVLKDLFDFPTFSVHPIQDPEGVEVFAALKNVIAMAAGFCDGLGQGSNTKAALIRMGCVEMLRFAQTFYPTVRTETMLESCGIADLVTTSYSGRNRKCSEAFAGKCRGQSWEQIEKEMLGGQHLAGIETLQQVHMHLKKRDMCHMFPMMETIYAISFDGVPPEAIVDRAESFARVGPKAPNKQAHGKCDKPIIDRSALPMVIG